MHLSSSLRLLSLYAGLAQSAWPFPSFESQQFTENPLNERIIAQGLIGNHFGRPPLAAAFDYVVLGGGTGGLAIARRLAANGSVAVIEAGSFYEMNNGNLSEVPADAFYYLGSDPQENNPLIDWQQYTTPQEGLGGRTALYPSGRTFGGGSARNQMWYHRGTLDSYEKWADEVGDDSYTFNNLLPFYEKSVQFTPPNTAVRAANATTTYDLGVFSSSGGPLQVAYPNWANPISSWVAKGLEELGLTRKPGFTNGDLTNGYSYCASTQEPLTQERCSSEVSFLREALTQTNNLLIYQNTMARRILFNGTKATGVELTSGSLTTRTTFNITVNKEVIVSSGAFRSPQILMVSGIGPREVLEQHNIKVLADRPGVGQNMWDHILFGPAYRVNVETHTLLAQPEYLNPAITAFNQNRTGILTNVGADMLAFDKLPSSVLQPSVQSELNTTFGPTWPDIEIIILDAYAGNARDLLTGSPHTPYAYSTPFATLVAPFSRGNVTICSNSTLDNPIISPNWLQDPRDQQVAIAAYKRVRQLYTSNAMKPVIIGDEVYPGLNVATDAQILKAVMDSAMTVYHAAATCKMGKTSDPMAVIDSHARVIGVEGVRVVDASAFPFLPPGHPQSTVYMLAEKISDDIIHGE